MKPSRRFVDLIVILLLTASVGGSLVAMAAESLFDIIVDGPITASLFAFLLLLPVTAGLVITNHPRRHLALGGTLITLFLFSWGFGLPRVT